MLPSLDSGPVYHLSLLFGGQTLQIRWQIIACYNFSVDKQICPCGGYIEELVDQDSLLIWMALFDLNLCEPVIVWRLTQCLFHLTVVYQVVSTSSSYLLPVSLFKFKFGTFLSTSSIMICLSGRHSGG